MVFVLKRGASRKEIAELEEKLEQLPQVKGLDAKKYCGVLSLNSDPMEIQKQLRDEWEQMGY